MYLARMGWPGIVLEGLTVVLALTIALPRRARVTAMRTTFLSRTHAYMDPSFVAAFDRDTRRMARLLGLMVLLGGTVTAVIANRMDSRYPPPEVNIWLLSVPIVAVGLVIYPIVRLRTVHRLFRVPDHTTTVARPVQVTVSDYVGGWTRLLTWSMVATACACTGVLVILAHGGRVDTLLAAACAADAGLAVVLMVVTEWFGRALSSHPTPAVDASHLYLQDAWRAYLLSRAHTHVGYICHLLFYGLVFTFQLPDWLYNSAGLLVVFALASAYPLLQFVQPRQFRRRLWRSLSPGEILYPGQPVPSLEVGA